ncbi:hypothetical protein AB0M79_28335 [Polymorphospora sp. NPDC051019]|uniref:hypothetical protein n=1 Tax=Polymorphospora sp. NPDC051019 TaxID=3155725 RepID=UPI00343BB75F
MQPLTLPVDAGLISPQPRCDADHILDLLHDGLPQDGQGSVPDEDALRAAADLIAQQIALLRRADTELVAALRGALTQADHFLRDTSGAMEHRYRQFVDLVRRWIIWAVNTRALTVADANNALRYLTMPPPLRSHFEATVYAPLAIEVDSATSDDAVSAAEQLLRVDLRGLHTATVHATEPWQLRLRVLDEEAQPVTVRQYRYHTVWVVPLVVTVQALDQREAIPIAVDTVTADLDHLEVARPHTDKIRAVDIVPVEHHDYNIHTD